MGPPPVSIFYFLFFIYFIFVFIFIFRQLNPRDASPCVCLPHSFIRLIVVPLPLLHFYFAVWCTRCRCPCLPTWVVLHCLHGCLSCPPTRILCGYPLFISLLFVFCFLVFPPKSLPDDDVLCRLLPRPLPSVCFVPFFCFVFLWPCSFPVCFGVTSSIL